jgi:DNA replication and repair protein RecF
LTAAVRFQRVAVRALRNLTAVDFEAAPRLNVISGSNGQGKTSLIESLYLVATSRSFRTDKLRELVQEGTDLCAVRTQIAEGTETREQRVTVGPQTRTLLIDGKRPPRVAAYATRTPVVVFHPGDLALVNGPAAGRRVLLARVALFLVPGSDEHRRSHARALRERQRTLEERGALAPELDAYERLLGEYGAALAQAQALAAHELLRALDGVFGSMAPPGLSLVARYVPRGSQEVAECTAQLRAQRPADLRRGSAGFGPHRDDIELSIDGRPARRQASQGQQRILTLALKLAELECVRAARDAHPVLLLDDVSSELDPERTGAVYDLLRSTPSQVFITTTRPELLTTPDLRPDERTDWVLERGVLGAAR